MRGSASGPLGALLLIAPLAAIPVFAIFGVPQFAPVVASPGDDEEGVDVIDAAASSSLGPADSDGKTRAADDLFAPVSPVSPAPDATSSLPRAPRTAVGAGVPSAGSKNPPPGLPSSEVLDQWEIRPDVATGRERRGDADALRRPESTRNAPAGAANDLQIPGEDAGDGRVSAEGFATDLLKPDLSSRKRQNPQPPGRSPAEAPIDKRGLAKGLRSENPGDDSPSLPDGLVSSLSEQSGWQAAARRLKELGIRKYRLESQIEEQKFIFLCSFSSPDNPRVVRRFEAEADNPLEAVENVLEQIDEWRSRENADDEAATLRDEDA